MDKKFYGVTFMKILKTVRLWLLSGNQLQLNRRMILQYPAYHNNTDDKSASERITGLHRPMPGKYVGMRF